MRVSDSKVSFILNTPVDLLDFLLPSQYVSVWLATLVRRLTD